jgi:hypothetical protein
MSRKYEAPHCATSSILLLLHPSLGQISSLESCSQTPSIYACFLFCNKLLLCSDLSSGEYCCVNYMSTDDSEVRAASIIRAISVVVLQRTLPMSLTYHVPFCLKQSLSALVVLEWYEACLPSRASNLNSRLWSKRLRRIFVPMIAGRKKKWRNWRIHKICQCHNWKPINQNIRVYNVICSIIRTYKLFLYCKGITQIEDFEKIILRRLFGYNRQAFLVWY